LLLHIPVLSLSRAELRRLLLRLPALRDLDAGDRQVLMDTIGGHPRLIEFVNALVRGGRGSLREVTIKLRTLAEGVVTPTGQRGLDQAMRDAVLLGSRDILLDTLLQALTSEERELLLQAAVSTVPQSRGDLAVARWGNTPTPAQQTSVLTAAERLVDLTLLSSADDDEIVVHPWIADSVSTHHGDHAALRHHRAVSMRLARLQSGRGGFADLVEICRHHAAAEQFEELLAFAFAAVAALETQVGEYSVAAFLGEVVPMVPADTDGFLPLSDRESQALLNTGSVSAATQRAHAILAAAHKRTEADPTNAQAQRDLSISYERLGDLMLQLGDGAQAERFYRDSLTIRERLAQADPTNAQAQRDLSISYERLGDLMLQLGDGAQAERFYRDSLTIAEITLESDDPWTQSIRDKLRSLKETTGSD
jgi:hypothetical protein